ncbi:hypothetical protein L6R53_02805 [Myxococcota bacterium]|nr:hypothetical protein [Myxococcota bacterium]
MVPRPRLLLSAAAGGGLLALLPACPAEQLGVELPRGGAQAISQEDLRRDTWLVQERSEAPAGEVAARLSQMRLLPAFGSEWVRPGDGGPVACGRKDGAGEGIVLVIAVGDPATPAGAVAWAGLISLAKGWDLPGVPEGTRVLCVAPGAEAAAALRARPPVPVGEVRLAVELGPLWTEEPSLRGPAGAPPTWVLSAPEAAPSSAGAVDYRVVEAGVRSALARIDALAAAQGAAAPP